MSTLEKAIGTLLFIRDPRGIRLTPAGERFRRHAKRILRDVDDAMKALRDDRSGRLRIGYAPSHREAAVTAVDGMMRALKTKAVKSDLEIRLQMHELSSSRIETWITDGRLDLGLVDARSGAGGFLYEQLGDAPLRLIVNKDREDFRGRRRIETLDELARQSFVLPAARLQSRKAVEAYFGQHEIAASILVEATAIATVLALVRSMPMFVAILPVPAPQRQELRGLSLLDLPGKVPSLATYLLRRETPPDEPQMTVAANAYRNALLAHLGLKQPATRA